MTERVKLEELLKRVEACEGPDREIDAEIFCVLNPEFTPSHRCEGTRHSYGAGYCFKNIERYGILIEDGKKAPKWSADLNAALDLVAEVVPDAYWRLERTNPSHWDKRPFWATCGKSGEQEIGYGATPAVALLAALLLAKLSATPSEEGEKP